MEKRSNKFIFAVLTVMCGVFTLGSVLDGTGSTGTQQVREITADQQSRMEQIILDADLICNKEEAPDLVQIICRGDLKGGWALEFSKRLKDLAATGATKLDDDQVEDLQSAYNNYYDSFVYDQLPKVHNPDAIADLLLDSGTSSPGGPSLEGWDTKALVGVLNRWIELLGLPNDELLTKANDVNPELIFGSAGDKKFEDLLKKKHIAKSYYQDLIKLGGLKTQDVIDLSNGTTQGVIDLNKRKAGITAHVGSLRYLLWRMIYARTSIPCSKLRQAFYAEYVTKQCEARNLPVPPKPLGYSDKKLKDAYESICKDEIVNNIRNTEKMVRESTETVTNLSNVMEQLYKQPLTGANKATILGLLLLNRAYCLEGDNFNNYVQKLLVSMLQSDDAQVVAKYIKSVVGQSAGLLANNSKKIARGITEKVQYKTTYGDSPVLGPEILHTLRRACARLTREQQEMAGLAGGTYAEMLTAGVLNELKGATPERLYEEVEMLRKKVGLTRGSEELRKELKELQDQMETNGGAFKEYTRLNKELVEFRNWITYLSSKNKEHEGEKGRARQMEERMEELKGQVDRYEELQRQCAPLYEQIDAVKPIEQLEGRIKELNRAKELQEKINSLSSSGSAELGELKTELAALNRAPELLKFVQLALDQELRMDEMMIMQAIRRGGFLWADDIERKHESWGKIIKDCTSFTQDNGFTDYLGDGYKAHLLDRVIKQLGEHKAIVSKDTSKKLNELFEGVNGADELKGRITEK